jgi:hypothetical protein
MEMRESNFQSELAQLTILGVSHCTSTELIGLGMEVRESLLQSELALLTILEVSHCMSTELIAWDGDEGVKLSI